VGNRAMAVDQHYLDGQTRAEFVGKPVDYVRRPEIGGLRTQTRALPITSRD
jgi:hypothetical protein